MSTPAITITSIASLTLDGKPAGKVADAIANNRALAPDIQRALEAWDAERTAASKAAVDAAKAEAATLKQALGEHQVISDEAVAKAAPIVAALAQKCSGITELNTLAMQLIAVLQGAQTGPAARKAAQLADALAKLDAQRAQLESAKAAAEAAAKA